VTRNRGRALLEGIAAVAFWGASFIATKIALREIHPFSVIWLRFGMGVLVLALAVGVRREFRWPARRDILLLGFLGFLGITLHQWIQVTGLLTAKASTTAWIITTSPVFIAILGRIFLNEMLTRGRLVGIALAACGVLLITTGGDASLIAQRSLGEPGNWLVLLSAVTWAVFSVVSRHALRSIAPTLALLFVLGSGWLLVNPLLLFAGDLPLLPASPEGWGAVLFLGVFCSGLAYIFWYNALHVMPASHVGSLLYLEPIVTVGAAAVLLQEPITLLSLAAGAIIVLGVWLVTRQRGPGGPETPAPSPEGRRRNA
jgi:drug/metabolite transporter (DMT)-like permease